MVEPDRNNYPNLLQEVKNYLKKNTGEKVPYAQHLHRLDRPVSGLVLFTKKKEVLKNLSEQFAERRIQKFYQALTIQEPSMLKGSLEHWHRKEKKKAVLVPEGTEFAEKVKLDYEVFPHQHRTSRQHFYRWEIQLHTGKFHQIRAQLASQNCPIVGDVLYGSSSVFAPDAIALHACKLMFQHPVSGEKLTFESKAEFL
jgi:23S rRNA pseudouridine955/2504/2580 synthase/23S rRNA pseudouridine1911/1915/1917 synthase